MECLSGCGHDGNGRCTKKPGCARVSAMAEFINNNDPILLAEVIEAGGVTMQQWAEIKGSVEDVLRADIRYEQRSNPDDGRPRKQYLTTFRRRD